VTVARCSLAFNIVRNTCLPLRSQGPVRDVLSFRGI
jgi:hypothetical protein